MRVAGFMTCVALAIVGPTAPAMAQSQPPPPSPPAMSSVGAFTLRLSASVYARVSSRNSAFRWWVEYGSSPGYGLATPVQTGAPGSFRRISAPLPGLSYSTTYHYRVVAENATGRTASPDAEFTTKGPLSLAAPIVSRTPFRFGSVLPGVVTSTTPPAFPALQYEPYPQGRGDTASVTLNFERLARGRRQAGRCVRRTRKNRSAKPCQLVLPAGSLAVPQLRNAASWLRFAGRLDAWRTLQPGVYRMKVAATTSEGISAVSPTTRFELLPLRRPN